MAPNDNASYQLSIRGQHAYQHYDFLSTYLNTAAKNKYDPITNPGGVVNFGTAVNHLMEKELQERLRREDVFFFTSERHQHYCEFNGKLTLRTAVSNFFNRYMNVATPVHPEELVVMSGSAACLDALSHALFNPDDIYLTPTPTYGRIFTNFNERALATPIALPLPENLDENGFSFQLDSDLLEDKILELKKDGKIVKGFVLINPQNPLGDVYSPTVIRSILEVCAKYQLQVVIDEVYALTISDPSTPVTSVMSLSNLPDPQRTHVVWALSKDFCLPGFRLGVVWSKNEALRKVLRGFSIYSSSASIIQDAATAVLSDFKWLDEIYFPRNKERLRKDYEISVDKLKEIGAVVRNSEAGLYVWFHLKKYLTEQTEEGEMELFEELFDAGVYIVPGSKLHCGAPGWFRMVFAVSPAEIKKGFEVMNKVLRKREKYPTTRAYEQISNL